MTDTTTNKETQDKFAIEVEPLDFADSATSASNFITSFNLCTLINEVMKNVFDDYEGSTFEVYQAPNGAFAPTVNLWFNHRDYDDDAVRGFTQNVGDEEIKNEVLKKVRKLQRQQKDGGNQYNITKLAKEGLEPFMFVNNPKQKINWKMCATDVGQPYSNETLSKVSGVNPVKLIEMIYGKKADDTEYDYDLSIKRSLAPQSYGMSAGYLLQITRIDKVQLDRCLRDAGFVNPNGLGIVK